MNSIHTGTVTDNQDPDGTGRIRISLYLSCELTETDWLPVLSLSAGESRGLFCLPDVGDLVLAVFTDNSFRIGYILGSLWNQNMELPLSEENSDGDLNADGNNALHFFRSRSGQRIIVDDTEGAEKIQLLNADGTSRIELDAENELINLETELDICIRAAGTLLLEAEEIDLSLEGNVTGESDSLGFQASGEITVKSDKSVIIEGSGVAIN